MFNHDFRFFAFFGEVFVFSISRVALTDVPLDDRNGAKALLRVGFYWIIQTYGFKGWIYSVKD
jgi:hypothetical protein